MSFSQKSSRSSFYIILAILVSIAFNSQSAQTLPSAEHHITVDTPADDPTKSACSTFSLNDCSLRGAISYANSTASGSVIYITIPANTYNLAMSGTGDDANASGDLDVMLRTVFLQGAGREITIIDGLNLDRVLDNQGGPLTIEHLKVTHGQAPEGDSGGGGILNRGGSTLYLDDVLVESNLVLGTSQYIDNGGGVSNNGILTIHNSSIVNNSACNGGGIVSNGAWMTVQATTIGQNLARSDTNCGDGGGIATINGSWKFEISNTIVDGNDAVRGAGIFFNGTGGTIRAISETQISYNEATSSGGGLSNYGDITLNRVSLSANTVPGNGGGADNMGTLVLNNVTVSANVALYGGGLANHGNKSITLDHCTVANNVAGGAGRALLADPLSQNTFHNTILASNTITETCAMLGSLDNLGYNLSIDESCGLSEYAYDLIGINPILGVLDNNGGSTLTMALLPGNPAIDTADPDTSQTRDQRGYFRPVNGISDMGAYERASFPLDIYLRLPLIQSVP